MPIQLATPVERKPIVMAEVIYFNADLRAMTVLIGFAHMDEDGVVIKTTEHQCSLVDAEKNPRFTPEEYASVKGALYRLSFEDGLVAGTPK